MTGKPRYLKYSYFELENLSNSANSTTKKIKIQKTSERFELTTSSVSDRNHYNKETTVSV